MPGMTNSDPREQPLDQDSGRGLVREEARLNKQIDKRINRRRSPVRSGVGGEYDGQGIRPQNPGRGIRTATGRQSEQMRNRNFAPDVKSQDRQSVVRRPVNSRMNPSGRAGGRQGAIGRYLNQ